MGEVGRGKCAGGKVLLAKATVAENFAVPKATYRDAQNKSRRMKFMQRLLFYNYMLYIATS